MVVPLIAAGRLKDVFAVRRDGYDAAFTETEFALARSFADLVAVALENADLRAWLEQQANTDPLTGLPNRRYFSEQLSQRTSTAHDEGSKLSVLLIDVDRLKLTNDTLGHNAGDRLLATVAQTLTSNLREGDLAARLAGDEFAVLLSHTDAVEARVIAARLVRAISSAHKRPPGFETRVRAWVGPNSTPNLVTSKSYSARQTDPCTRQRAAPTAAPGASSASSVHCWPTPPAPSTVVPGCSPIMVGVEAGCESLRGRPIRRA